MEGVDTSAADVFFDVFRDEVFFRDDVFFCDVVCAFFDDVAFLFCAGEAITSANNIKNM